MSLSARILYRSHYATPLIIHEREGCTIQWDNISTDHMANDIYTTVNKFHSSAQVGLQKTDKRELKFFKSSELP